MSLPAIFRMATRSPLVSLGRNTMAAGRKIPGRGGKYVFKNAPDDLTQLKVGQGISTQGKQTIVRRLSEKEKNRLLELKAKDPKSLNQNEKDLLGELQDRENLVRQYAGDFDLLEKAKDPSSLSREETSRLRNYGLGGAEAGMFALPIAAGLGAGVVKDYGSALGLRESPQAEQMRRAQMMQQAQVSAQSMQMRQQQMIEDNIRRLARINPQAAQELMVGRQLPMGATVIGGQPRQDLMQQVGAQMGQTQSQPDPMFGQVF